MRLILATVPLVTLAASNARAEAIFVEAESFTLSADGWRVLADRGMRDASGTQALNGATGEEDAVATKTIAIAEAGRFRIWVRHTSHERWRGPFRVATLQNGRELAGAVFDETPVTKSARVDFVWSSFDADLPAGEVTLQLSKHQQKNCSGLARTIDCLLVTSDLNQKPNHLHYGLQTFLRVTLAGDYSRPAYLHVFADHFHAPWYQHWSLARGGAVQAVSPKKTDLLGGGEATPWCNITPMLYHDGGALLNLSVRYGYADRADHLKARLEFATAADEKAIVRTIEADCRPNGMVIAVPPNLATPENIALLKIDREIAEATGKLADAFDWPTYGRKPTRFPFFVSARLGEQHPFDAAVAAREQKTLDYFGFTPREGREVRGVWLMQNDSYCRPDVEKMKARAAQQAAEFKTAGHDVKNIVFCELTDEPTGQPLTTIAKDDAYREAFRAWLKRLNMTPAELLVGDWDAVRIVTEAERDQFPALYYFSQRFRTRALGDFMATQRRVLEEAHGRTLPTLANFSDGAIYAGNFYNQGVDYFELLSSPDQNAIWGEDWANNASTYQCASYNVDLMRAAARERGQIIGQHLIAYAGRKPWDVKLKATSELARGVKIFNSFFYGPTWASHEGGPYWRSHAWSAKPPMWRASAELTREIGAVEDLLIDAMPARAETALLYSSASDVWTVGQNLAFGFDRMHTWLALVHAQIPVDVVHETQAADGALDDYRVCYLSGTHLTRRAADKLKAWVERGGILWLTAGAAMRDEYNRPLATFDELLPTKRGELQTLQAYLGAGGSLATLVNKDEVRWEIGAAETLSVKQTLTPNANTIVLARFGDGSPAGIVGNVGKGRLYCLGFLPALAYIKPALVARKAIDAKLKASEPLVDADRTLVERSANPWDFPANVRDFLLAPVRTENLEIPLACDTPLVDAVYMRSDAGVLIPLANYTLRPLEKVTLYVALTKPIARVESARHGAIPFTQSDFSVTFSLPLEANDFVKLYDR